MSSWRLIGSGHPPVSSNQGEAEEPGASDWKGKAALADAVGMGQGSWRGFWREQAGAWAPLAPCAGPGPSVGSKWHRLLVKQAHKKTVLNLFLQKLCCSFPIKRWCSFRRAVGLPVFCQQLKHPVGLVCWASSCKFP